MIADPLLDEQQPLSHIQRRAPPCVVVVVVMCPGFGLIVEMVDLMRPSVG